MKNFIKTNYALAAKKHKIFTLLLALVASVSIAYAGNAIEKTVNATVGTSFVINPWNAVEANSYYSDFYGYLCISMYYETENTSALSISESQTTQTAVGYYKSYRVLPLETGNHTLYVYARCSKTTSSGTSTTTATIMYHILVSPQPVVTSISIPENMTLSVGESHTFSPVIYETGATTSLTWQSSNASCVSVNNGTITALVPGEARITCTADNGIKAYCDVTVNSILVSTITFDKDELELSEGERYTLQATVLPADASNKTLTWSSSNEDVAFVSNKGTVIGVGNGYCNITATATDGSNVNESCLVHVRTIQQFTATILSNDASKGTVTGSGTYDEGATIQVSATPNEGYQFIQWSDGITGNPRIIVLTQDTTLTAEFELAKCLIASGTCGADGDNLTWELSCDSVLTISGTGEMEGLTTDEMSAIMNENIQNGNASSGDIPSALSTIPSPFSEIRENIKTIVFTDGLSNIGGGVFILCSNLTSIEIASSVTKIGDGAFILSGLDSIFIPVTVDSIGEMAFSMCNDLRSVQFESEIPPVLSKSSMKGTFVYTNSCDFFVPCGTKEAYIQALNVNSDRVLEPEECGAQPCLIASGTCGADGDNLTWELSCDSVLTISGIGNMADYRYNSSPWYSQRNKIKSSVIEDDVTSIGGCAFYDCTGLISIEIPNSVTNIGSSAFSGCTGLTSIEIPNSVTSIGSSTFSGCTGLTSPVYNSHVFAYMPISYTGAYSIPNGIETIAGNAFSYCSSLTSIAIPHGVTSIEYGTFYGCSRMTSVTIPNSVINICDSAFIDCTSLTSLTIPNSVTRMGDNAFGYCNNLVSITCEAINPPSSGYWWINSTIPLYVPCEAIEAYRNANVWSDFTNIYAIGYVDYSYSVTSADENQGTVTITDEEIDCEKKEISFRADANEGYHFVQWSDGITDNPRTIILTHDTVITAEFVSTIKTITLLVDDETRGYVNGEGTYDEGSIVTITATPNELFVFDYWTNGTDKFYEEELSVTLTQDTIFTAHFRPWTVNVRVIAYNDNVVSQYNQNYYCSDSLVPCGYFYTLNDIPIVYNQSFYTFELTEEQIIDIRKELDDSWLAYCQERSYYDLYDEQAGYYEPLVYIAPIYYPHLSLEDKNKTDIDLMVETNRATYSVDISPDDETMGYVIANTQMYYENYGYYNQTFNSKDSSYLSLTCGTNMDMEAIPYPGYRFKEWSYYYYGHGSTENPLHINIDEYYFSYNDVRITAIFEPISISATITTNDTTMGYVTPDGNMQISYGESLEIEATPYEGFLFIQWSDGITDNPRTVVLTQDTTITAIFEPETVNMSADLAMIYINGNPIEGFAPDKYGYTFRNPAGTHEEDLPTMADVSWDLGDEYQTVEISQVATTILLNVTSGRGLTKVYVLAFVIEYPNQYTVTTLSNNEAWGMVIGGNVYNANSRVSVGAFAEEGYQFYHWNNSTTANPYTFTLTQDTTFAALFLPNTAEDIITDVTSNSVHMEWEVKHWGNHGYWIWIYVDKDHKKWYCKMRFYMDGTLDKFYWGPASRNYDPSEPNQIAPRYLRHMPARHLSAPQVISFDLDDLEANQKYFFTLEDVNEQEQVLSAQAGTFTTPRNTPTDLDEIEETIQPQKVIKDNHIFILRGDKVYTIHGQEIK